MKSSFRSAALLLAMTPCVAQAQDPFTTTADATGIVRIIAADGDIRIRPSDGAQVRLIDLDREEDDRGMRLRRNNGEVQVDVFDDRDVEVRVPAGSRLDIRTRNGDIDIDGVRGSISLETLSGDMRVGGTPSSVTVESISGDITVDGSVETLRLSTVSGDIDLPRATGSVNANTTSGDVTIVSAGVRSGEISSTSGEVRYRGTIPRDAVLEFTSASGDIELEVGRDVAADFDIENVTGRIRNDIGPEPRRNRWTNGEALTFTNGGGGARITIQNVSGVVYLVAR